MVQEAVKKKMTHGEADIFVGAGRFKRPITDQERGCLREERLENIPAEMIKTLI